MHARRLLGFVIVVALGCGCSKSIAPVSGKVTLDGAPLANATVVFAPVAAPGTVDAGVGSTGKTNDKGEYTLQTSNGRPGAIVGKHVVSISLLETQAGDGDGRAPRGGKPLANKVPRKYNDPSELTLDVPSGGTTTADFPLTSK